MLAALLHGGARGCDEELQMTQWPDRAATSPGTGQKSITYAVATNESTAVINSGRPAYHQ